VVLSVSHKIDFRSNPHPLPWILIYNQNAGKSSREPRPRRHPIIMKANPQEKTKPEEKQSTALGWQSFHPWQSSLGGGLEID
jgi:hypothetical protein